MSKYVEYLLRQQWYWHCGTVDPKQTKTICKTRILCSIVYIYICKCIFTQPISESHTLYAFMIPFRFSVFYHAFIWQISAFFLVGRKSSIIFVEIRSSIAKMWEQCALQILWIIWRNPSNNRQSLPKNVSFSKNSNTFFWLRSDWKKIQSIVWFSIGKFAT